ncbi:MAG: DUF448 domain-containing protein [Syntrophus sp. (in: bacteria)]|nr:DUF448 domain-containing protein [Geobacteraceae bacterium]MDY0189072.1 DUF448 domain-containing protein [Syntrophus sp. (in: bacteria)]
MTKAIPRRTCVACRRTCEKEELVRFVLSPDGVLVPDLLKKLPGRGVYTCSKESCIRQACERKQFSRAFAKEVTGADTRLLLDGIIKSMEDRIASYISLANKAGKIVSGSDMVADSIRRNGTRLGLVLIAADVSDDIGKKVRGLADQHGVEAVTIFDKDRYGALLGKGLRSVLAVQGQGFSEKLKMEIERYRNFLRGEGCAE